MNKKDTLFEALSNTSENVYIFKCDMKTGISHWSENAIEYFALGPEYKTNALEVWLEKIHPDDRMVYKKDIDEVFSGKKANHSCQYRAKNRYGDYVWLECIGNVVLDEDGKGKMFAGLITRLDSQNKYDPTTKQLSIHEFYLKNEMKEKATLLCVGMDKFRKIIANFGYEQSNNILTVLANVLAKTEGVRYVYRMEGDEFLVIFPSISEEEVKEKFYSALKRFKEKMLDLKFTASFSFSGAAIMYEPGECTKEILVKRLEHTMEEAKLNGVGNVVLFTDTIEEKFKRLSQISFELEHSVKHNFEGFELYYQPIKESKSGKIRAVEALLRYHSKTLGMISPIEFIPILESSRMITAVGKWVMQTAVKQCKEWNEKYHIVVGFNVSYLQLYNRSFIEQLISTVEEYEVQPNLISVELTESCKVMDTVGLATMFDELKNYGFRVALDDFGMEYSSLTLIRDLPVTTVKIDHSFVRTLEGNNSREDQANFAIISCISDMCKKLQINVVVEGVETSRIEEMLKEMNVQFLQGYCYSKPIPAKEVEKFFVA